MMMPSPSAWFPIPERVDWVAFLLEASLKGTLLLALAAAVNLALRHGSAATRHWVWTTAMVALLLLPASLLLLPGWSVQGVRFPAVTWKATAADPVASPTPAIAPPEVEGPRRVHESPSPRMAARRELAPLPERSRAATLARTAGASPAAIVPLLWLAGMAIALSPMLLGRIALRRLAREARPLESEVARALAAAAASALGVRREVEVLESARTAMPLTWGIREPRLLLPLAARAWPPERLRAVLLHEMAHVRRWDCLTQTLTQLACALFWFHPGVWHAARCLRAERERACDDRVLGARIPASDYAGHLLDVVRSLRGLPAPAWGAVAFARSSRFEGRLKAVLDPRHRREALSLARALRIAAAAIGVFVGLAALKPSPGAAGMEAEHVRADRKARLVGGASEVTRAPDPSQSLEARWTWALAEAGGRRKGDDFWIGYLLPSFVGEGEGALCDSDGIDVSVLDGGYEGPTLRDVLEGRSARAPRASGKEDGDHELAVLAHLRSGAAPEGEIDRLRAQTLSLPAEIGRRPLYWLGEASDEQSLALLRRLERRAALTDIRSQVLDVVALHRATEIVLPCLLETLRGSDDDDVRAQAAEGLARHPVPEALEVLIRTARADRSREVRMQAIEALGQVDRPESDEALLQIVGTKGLYPAERRTAIEALRQRAAAGANPGAPEAPETPETPETPAAPGEEPGDAVLDQPLQPPQPPQPPAPARTLPPSDRLSPEQVEAERRAVESLGHMGEAVSLMRLKSIAWKHSSPEVRRQAAESIGALGTEGALGVLTELIWRHPDQEVQRQAVESLHGFPEESAASVLMRVASHHPRPEVRRQAVESLSRFSCPDVSSFLGEAACGDEDSGVAREAIESLGRLPGEVGVPRLKQIAKTHPDPEMRRAALEALEQEERGGSLPVIEEMLKEKPKRHPR